MASIDGEVRRSDVGLVIILLIQVATIFVVAPLAATDSASPQLVEGLRLGLAATTILIVARRAVTRLLIAAAFVATLAVPLHWQLGQSVIVVAAVKTLVTIGFDVAVAGMVAVAAFGPGRVTIHRILGGVILYLSFGLIFAGVYHLLLLAIPAGFGGLAAGGRAQFGGLLYFSFGALTTSGSGDLVAMHPLMRSTAALEAVIGQLYPVTLLGRLVSLHTAAQHVRDDKAS
jgi:hypothetical protein